MSETLKTPLTDEARDHCNNCGLDIVLVDDAEKIELRLAASEAARERAEQLLRSRNCDDLCLEHVRRAEAAEARAEQLQQELQQALKPNDVQEESYKKWVERFNQTKGAES